MTSSTASTADWRDRTDRHAPRASLHPAARQPWQYAYDTDEIELACPLCTLILDRGEWAHDPACARAARRTA